MSESRCAERGGGAVSLMPPALETDRVDRPPDAKPRSVLNLSEVVVGGAVVAVALLAWSALILAHLGWFSLGSVLGLFAAFALIVAAACKLWAPFSIRVDRTASVGIVVLGILSALMFFPGFHYGATDKDPGGYVAHAMSIARTGSYQIVDPTLDGRIPGGPQLSTAGSRFPGAWINHGDVIVPQFYHLWPSLMAVAVAVDGDGGVSNTAPLCGVLAVLAAALALRRAVAAAPWGSERAGLACGGIAAVLLGTNMLEVWQAKYPSSEISSQMLFLGSLLGLVLAFTARSRVGAGVAGLLTGVGFLDRGDGLLFVLIAVAGLAGFVALRRWDARVTWFAAGLGVVLPHALWQAYSFDAAGAYSKQNLVPSLPKVIGICASLLVVGLALRSVGPRVAAWFERRTVQLWTGLAVTCVSALLLALGFLRPQLFGKSREVINGVLQRSYDDQIMERLSWFISAAGLVVMVAGIAVLALRKWTAALWTLALPLLLLFPVYGYKARNSVRLMWWTRRYVPTILPLVLVLIALFLGVLLTAVIARAPGWRGWLGGHRAWLLRLGALAGAVAIVTFYLNESWPLRKHQEFGGSFAVTASIAATAGDKQGVFLWEPDEPCCAAPSLLFGEAIWFERDQVSALLPSDPAQMADYVRAFQKGFPGQPVFIIWQGQNKPVLPGLQLAVAKRIQTQLPIWQESVNHRPKHSIDIKVNFAIYRATPS